MFMVVRTEFCKYSLSIGCNDRMYIRSDICFYILSQYKLVVVSEDGNGFSVLIVADCK